MINGLELVRLYSEIENEDEDQRLFSEVDESLYEKAFCEGYEYAQREYAQGLGEKIAKKAKRAFETVRGAVSTELKGDASKYITPSTKLNKLKSERTWQKMLLDNADKVREGLLLGKVTPQGFNNTTNSIMHELLDSKKNINRILEKK